MTDLARPFDPSQPDAYASTSLLVFPTPRAKIVPSRQQLVDRVRDHVEAHLGEPLSIRALSRFAGVSPRTLEYAFQDALGMPPITWYRSLRFAAARRALARSEPKGTSVTKIATRFGFYHLGRFSVGYRRRFGESPSQTLRRPISAPPDRALQPKSLSPV